MTSLSLEVPSLLIQSSQQAISFVLELFVSVLEIVFQHVASSSLIVKLFSVLVQIRLKKVTLSHLIRESSLSVPKFILFILESFGQFFSFLVQLVLIVLLLSSARILQLPSFSSLGIDLSSVRIYLSFELVFLLRLVLQFAHY